MFWQKNNKINLVFVVFGIVALGIILATAILLIKLSIKIKQVDLNKPTNMVGVEDVYQRVFQIKANYQKGIEDLLISTTSTTDNNTIYENVDKVFFAIRVPQELREIHLNTLMNIYKIKETKLSDLEKREKVMDELNKLLVEIKK
ncbi:MAG TPA: hypothetical protein DEB09_05865 [Candidatus Magasanikbacteria bacterium]|nr:hypothetical protein [Candidatus Magasanikbacteria bacterium]